MKTLVGLVVCLVTAGAQEQRPAYQPMRNDENWSVLSDGSQRSDWLDPLKYLPLSRAGWYLTLGGEIREKFELLDEPGFGIGPDDENGYLLQRYLLSADFHFGRRFRFFTELQSGLEDGRNGGPRASHLGVVRSAVLGGAGVVGAIGVDRWHQSNRPDAVAPDEIERGRVADAGSVAVLAGKPVRLRVSPFNTPLRAANPIAARYLATAPAATIGWQATRHQFYSVIYTHFFTGDFFQAALPNKDVNYLAAWVSYKF